MTRMQACAVLMPHICEYDLIFGIQSCCSSELHLTLQTCSRDQIRGCTNCLSSFAVAQRWCKVLSHGFHAGFCIQTFETWLWEMQLFRVVIYNAGILHPGKVLLQTGHTLLEIMSIASPNSGHDGQLCLKKFCLARTCGQVHYRSEKWKGIHCSDPQAGDCLWHAYVLSTGIHVKLKHYDKALAENMASHIAIKTFYWNSQPIVVLTQVFCCHLELVVQCRLEPMAMIC